MAFGNIEPSKKRLYINIGSLFDVPTAHLLIGKKGETIMNGGLGPTTLIVGRSNSFKSTLMHYMMFSAMSRINYSFITYSMLYDTELTAESSRLEHLASMHEHITHPLIDEGDGEGLLRITDKGRYGADKWFSELKIGLQDKANKKDTVEFLCFPDKLTEHVIDQRPKFIEIDSYSEFEPDATMEALDKSVKEDGSLNTLFLKQGAYKTKVSSMLGRLSNEANAYFLLSAHIGEEIVIPTGPMTQQPTKKLGYLKTGDKIKGVTDKTLYLMSNAWYIQSAKPLLNKGTRTCEYPLQGEEDIPDTDLSIVYATQLRGKNGGSGYSIPVIITQNDGVLPTLSEFHYIKESNRFGLGGNNINFSLDIYPSVNLTRPSVRTKINNDPKLRRAINITAELKQLHVYHPHLKNILCTPAELYVDLKNMGYNWDELLETRGWWTPNNYDTEIKYLSTVDLLRMRKGEYVPFWYDKKDKLNYKIELPKVS